MNPQTESNAVHKINKFILGFFLLLVIVFSITYGSIKLMEFYKMRNSAQNNSPVINKITEDEKLDTLASIESNSSVKEEDRMDTLEALSAEQEIDSESKTTSLNSLR